MDYLMNAVNESVGHLMMYHGSDLKLDKLKPTAYNAGHRLKSHSWSVFLWPTYELAYKWAAFVTCRNLSRSLKGKIDHWRPMGEHVKTGLNKYEFKVYVHRNSYNEIKNTVCAGDPAFYVYTVKSPIDSKFGIGNNNIQPEYSYDGELRIYDRAEYQLTGEVFDEIFEPCDEDKYQELRAFKGENIRGPLGLMFYPSDSILKRWTYVYKRIQQGTVKPGDDLDPVMAEFEQHEELKKQSIIVSDDDLYLNYEKWENGESHALIIHGLSGSGKSTLAKKIADEYKAHFVSTDVLAFMIVGPNNAARGRTTFEFIKENDIMLYRFFKQNNIPPDVFANMEYDPIKRIHTPEDELRKRELVNRYVHWLVFEQYERVVIEGGHAGIAIISNPKGYQDTPIIFKGTSLLKSVYRRALRDIDTPLDAIQFIAKIKSQYLDIMLPEVDAARSAVLKDKYDYKLVKEGVSDFGEIELETPNPHVKTKKNKIKVPSGIKDFKDFCDKIPNPEVAMAWFIKNKIRWTPNGGDNDHAFQWPDYLIKQKMGNCFDQTIFMHYYCQKKRIDHRMFLITWISDKNQGTGHAVPMYMKGNYVYIWLYFRPGVGTVAGPYRSYEEAKTTLDYYFSVSINKLFKSPTHAYSSFLSESDMAKFDQYYGDRSITQTQYICGGLGANLRSTHMMKLKYHGFMFPNPTLPVYDVIMTALQMLKFANSLVPMKEAVESELTVDEMTKRVHDAGEWIHGKLYPDPPPPDTVTEGGVSSKYTRRYKDFDEFCKYITTPEEVLNWYKANIVQWNKEDKEGKLNRKPFTWPDDMVRTKTGNCGDHAFFMHYFCKRFGIDHRVARISKNWLNRDSNTYVMGQHFICILKTNEMGWMVFDYSGPMEGRRDDAAIHRTKNSVLSGPFSSAEEAGEDQLREYNRYMHRTNHPNLRKVEDCEIHFLTQENLELLDSLYGRHDFNQIDYYKMIGKDIDSKYDYTEYAEHDLIDYISNKIHLGVFKVRSWLGESSSHLPIEEAKDTMYVDRFGNKKAKGDSNYIGTDANAIESEYVKAVEYIRLANLRNGTPQPVIMRNGGSYRARCEVIVLKGNKILLDRGKNRGGFGYSLPGGGIDPKESIAKGATRECEEEALVKPKHVKFMNVVWWAEFENPLFNKGSVSMVCIAEFGSYYDESKVKQEDRDEFADRAQWEDYRTANLGEPHMIAIERYLGREVAPKKIVSLHEEAVNEAKLKASERSCYGLPAKKKYPMPDESHVLQAIRMFNHCDPEDEEELARNIIRYMRKYNMRDVKVGKNNRFSKYYHPKAIDESLRMEGYKIQAFVNSSVRLLEMAGGGGPMIGMEINDQSVQYSTPGQYLINFSDTPDVRTNDYAVSNDLTSKYVYRKKKDKYVKETAEEFFKGKTIRVYKFIGEQAVWMSLLKDIDFDVCDEETTLYEDLTGKKELSTDQIDFDENFEYFDLSKYILESTMFKTTVAMMTNEDKRYEFDVPGQDHSKRYILKEDQKGIFLHDQLTGNRSPSFRKPGAEDRGK